MGPKGRNVVLDKSFGAPRITKDGVTVAKEIELSDKFENMGAQMVREVASKTNDIAGDGTTTATVLAQLRLSAKAAKAVAAGMNPMDLKRGIDLAVERRGCRSRGKRVQEGQARSEEIGQVGTISANGDVEVGEYDFRRPCRKSARKACDHGRGSQGRSTTELDVVEGMQFDRGYLSPYFVTNPEKMQVCRHGKPATS